MSQEGRDIIYSKPEDIMKLTCWYVNRYVRPLMLRLPLWVRVDPTLSDEDLIQDGITKVYSIADSYDPNDGALATWVVTVLHNYYDLRVRRMAMQSRHTPPVGTPISLDATTEHNFSIGSGKDRGLTLGEMIPDNKPSVEDTIIRKEEWETAMQLMNEHLSPRERYIILQRMKGKTLDDVGDEIGRTRERARQIETRALRVTSKIWRKKTKKTDEFLAGKRPYKNPYKKPYRTGKDVTRDEKHADSHPMHGQSGHQLPDIPDRSGPRRRHALWSDRIFPDLRRPEHPGRTGH